MSPKHPVGPRGGSLAGVPAFCRQIGANIRTARRKLDETQAELARRLDLSTNFIAHLERGSRKPSLDTLLALAKALEITLADLIDSGPPPPRTAKDSPRLRRAIRLLRTTPPDRLDLFIRLLEALRTGPGPHDSPPRRGRAGR